MKTKCKKKEEKIFLKAFAKLFVKRIGWEPSNIYIKYFKKEIHIFVKGIISEYEKYMVERFNDKTGKIFIDLYKKDCKYIQEDFLKNLDNKYICEIYDLESNFKEDIIVYKIRALRNK